MRFLSTESDDSFDGVSHEPLTRLLMPRSSSSDWSAAAVNDTFFVSFVIWRKKGIFPAAFSFARWEKHSVNGDRTGFHQHSCKPRNTHSEQFFFQTKARKWKLIFFFPCPRDIWPWSCYVIFIGLPTESAHFLSACKLFFLFLFFSSVLLCTHVFKMILEREKEEKKSDGSLWVSHYFCSIVNEWIVEKATFLPLFSIGNERKIQRNYLEKQRRHTYLIVEFALVFIQLQHHLSEKRTHHAAHETCRSSTCDVERSWYAASQETELSAGRTSSFRRSTK